MLVRRGPVSQFVTLQSGAWLALGGAVTMVIGASLRSPADMAQRAADHAWTAAADEPPAFVLGDPSSSIPPPR